jgi:hypothetical protein
MGGKSIKLLLAISVEEERREELKTKASRCKLCNFAVEKRINRISSLARYQ